MRWPNPFYSPPPKVPSPEPELPVPEVLTPAVEAPAVDPAFGSAPTGTEPCEPQVQENANVAAIAIPATGYTGAKRRKRRRHRKREPPACQHCYQRPCIGEEHELFALLHPLTEQQLFDRRMAQQERDLNEMEIRRTFNLPTPKW